MPRKNWITAKEAAALCEVSARTFYNWRRAGQGPKAYEFSKRKIFYDEADVWAWIETHKR